MIQNRPNIPPIPLLDGRALVVTGPWGSKGPKSRKRFPRGFFYAVELERMDVILVEQVRCSSLQSAKRQLTILAKKGGRISHE